jgi:fatty-acid peroxygenase
MVRRVYREGAARASEAAGTIGGGDEVALGAFRREVRRLYPFPARAGGPSPHNQEVVEGAGPAWGDWSCSELTFTVSTQSASNGSVDPDTLVPYADGEVTDRRCPAEGVALTMLAVAVRALAGCRGLRLRPRL